MTPASARSGRLRSFIASAPRRPVGLTEFMFSKGRPVFILDDPEGKSWVMKSAGLIVDPDQKFDQLKDLGSRLKPVPGWKFRVQVLGEDLILRPASGVAGIVQDELGSTYDLAGPGYSNYKPREGHFGKAMAGPRW
jgi:hypothetical protein